MGRTLLCVPILVSPASGDDAGADLGDASVVDAALRDVEAARLGGADIVEFRIDELFTGAVSASGGELDAREVKLVERLVNESPLPCIITCRSADEAGGVGGYDGDDSARVSLYEHLGNPRPGRTPPAYLDIEHAAYARSHNLKQKVNLAVDEPAQTRAQRSRLILSMHDHTGRPADLLRRVRAMQDEPAARVVKVAITPRSIRDNLELFDLLRDSRASGAGPMIALGMGRFGLLSRVLAPKFGAFLTFAALRAASATAPGQPTLRELVDVYRFASVSASTRVFGVIGWPVEHSLSPAVHNAGFERIGFDGVYVPMPVPPEFEHFKATVLALVDHDGLDFAGASVTLPHKEHLVRLARAEGWTLDAATAACGAGNTLVIRRDARGAVEHVEVMNSDAPSAAACLEASVAAGSLAGKTVAIIGAGGVARGVAVGVLERGGRVIIAARDQGKASALVEALKQAMSLNPTAIRSVAIASLVATEAGAGGADRIDELAAVVNATPVGMHGGPDPAGEVVDVAAVAARWPGVVVMDTVYTPRATPMLRRARSLGLATVDGSAMFVQQAQLQFQAWTGQRAPAGLFERIVDEARPA